MRTKTIITLAIAAAALPSVASAQGCIPVASNANLVFLSASDDMGAPSGLGFGPIGSQRPARRIDLSGMPEAPVVLVLSATSPKIWNLTDVRPDRLRGVIVAGQMQAVVGVPEHLPVATAGPTLNRNSFLNPNPRCRIMPVGLGGERTKSAITNIRDVMRIRPMGFSALVGGSAFDLSSPDSTYEAVGIPLRPNMLFSEGPFAPIDEPVAGVGTPKAERTGTHMVGWDHDGDVVRESFPDSSKRPTDPEAMMPIGSLGRVWMPAPTTGTSPFEAVTGGVGPQASAAEASSSASGSWLVALMGRLLAIAAGVAVVVALLHAFERRRRAETVVDDDAGFVPRRAEPEPHAFREPVRSMPPVTPEPTHASPASEADRSLRLLLDHVTEDETVLTLSRVRRSARTSAALDEDLAEERDRIVGPHLSGLVTRYVAAASAPDADGPTVETMLRESLGRLLAALEELNEAQRRRGVDGLATSGAFIRERHPGPRDGI